MFNVEAIIMHPQYNSQEKMDHDVAILKLNGKLQFNDRVTPICLPRTDVEDEYMCIVTGWGETQGTLHLVLLVFRM